MMANLRNRESRISWYRNACLPLIELGDEGRGVISIRSIDFPEDMIEVFIYTDFILIGALYSDSNRDVAYLLIISRY